jgi:DNA-binding response OmpR family regulator
MYSLSVASQSASVHGATKTTVLIVDDDTDFRGLVAFVVRAEGLIAVEAAYCRHALSVLRRDPERIVAVLLDYYMPGTAPALCVSAIRELITPTVPVVLVTAAVDATRRAKEIGLSQWLSKPFDLDELRNILRAAKREDARPTV